MSATLEIANREIVNNDDPGSIWRRAGDAQRGMNSLI
jgi:hypothetical protein